MVQVASLPGLEVSWYRDDCCLVVSLAGEMDLANASAFSDVVNSMPNGSIRHLIVDCSELTFMDSSGLKAMLEAHDLLGDVVLVAPTKPVGTLLTVTAVTDRFPIHPTVDEARSNLGHQSSSERV